MCKLREALSSPVAAPAPTRVGIIDRALSEADEETRVLLLELLRSGESSESVSSRLTLGGYKCAASTVRAYRRTRLPFVE